MMIKIFTFLLVLCCCTVFAGRPKHQYVKIKTDQGECIILLYNNTPLHRDNIIKLVKKIFIMVRCFTGSFNAL
jgi:hypothetical protein